MSRRIIRRYGASQIRRGRGGRAAQYPAGENTAVASLLSYADGTFTRASEASLYGNFAFPDGADDLSVQDLTWYGTDVLRQYSDNSVLIEGARTNDCQESEDLSAWTVGGGTVAGGTNTAPDGTGDGYSLSVPSSNYGVYLTQGSDATSHAFSIFLKRKGGNTVLSRHFGSNSSLALGAMVEPAAPVDWTRYSAVGTMPAGSRRIHLCEGRNAVPTGSSALGAQDQEIWGVMMEGGGAAFPSSYIRTSGAAATRAIDTLQMDAAGWDTTIATGHWEVDVWPLYASTEVGANRIVYWSRTTTQYVRIMSNGDVRLDGNGQNPVVSGVSWDRYDKLTIRVDHATGTIGVRVNGGSETTASASATTWTSAGALWVGHNGAGTSINARISEPRAA